MSMEAIEKELQEKMIEKPQKENITQEITELENATIVEKKPRSEAQKKAFEKARAKRMENLKKNREEEEAKLVEPKQVEFAEEPAPAPAPAPKKKRGRPKGVKNKKVMKHQEPPPTPDKPYYPHPVEYPIPQAQPPQYAFQGGQVPLNPHQVGALPFYQPPPQQAPVNNYYYYGAPPQQVANEEPEYEVVDSDEDEVIEPEHPEIAPEGAPPPTTTNPEFQYQEPLRYRFV